MTGRASEPRTESENTDRKPIQSAPVPDRTRPPATASPQTRGIPTISRQHGNRTPDHRARNRPNPWTESENGNRKPIQAAPVPDRTRPPATASPQNRRIPTIRHHHRNRTPDHQARYRPNPWTESGIARRNQDQSTPAPTMTHHADRNHTTNPRNTNNPSALQSSTITKPTTQNTRTTDQTGKHRTKSEPVHTHAGPCPADNHGIIAEARNHRDLITPSQSTAGVPGIQNTRTTDRTGKRKPKTDPVHTRTDHDTHPGNQATSQTRTISTISRQHEHRTTTTDDGWHCPIGTKQPQATAASISAARRRIRSLPRHIAVAALRGRSVPPDR